MSGSSTKPLIWSEEGATSVTPIHQQISEGIAYQIIRELILADPSIRSSLNLGCDYAYIDWLLARQFDAVTFRAVGTIANFQEINSELQLNNLEFYAGHALELLESGKLNGDIVYTSSAATELRNAELRDYSQLIAQKAKYWLMSEPVWTLPGGEIIDPKSVHPFDSMPAHVQRKPLSGDFMCLHWIHNYRAIIESAGFHLVEYRFYKPEYCLHAWCVVLGQNTDENLGCKPAHSH